MASGDAVGAIESIADDAACTLQPGAGVEWIIHNLFVPDGTAADGVDIAVVDATGSILIADGITSSMLQQNFHLSNTQYITMTNRSGGTILLGYDGIVVK